MKINDVIVESNQLDEGPFTDKLKSFGKAAMNRMPAGMLGGAAKLANRLGAKGTAQNLAGRTSLALTSKNLSNELQQMLGQKGLGISNLTPDLLAKFLTAKGVNIQVRDIPANQNGSVDRSTVGEIIRDISSKSLSGEPLVYRKPRGQSMGAESPAVRAYKAKKDAQQSSFKGYKSNNIPAAAQSTGAENYVQGWASSIKNAASKQEKIDLARELAAFLSDRAGTPEGSRGAQQALAMLKRIQNNAGDTQQRKSFVDPNDPDDVKSQAAKLRQKWNLGTQSTELVPPKDKFSPNEYKKIVSAIQQGKKLSPSLRVEAKDYKYFEKILESLGLTLTDLGLWKILKESTDHYVVLQTR